MFTIIKIFSFINFINTYFLIIPPKFIQIQDPLYHCMSDLCYFILIRYLLITYLSQFYEHYISTHLNFFYFHSFDSRIYLFISMTEINTPRRVTRGIHLFDKLLNELPSFDLCVTHNKPKFQALLLKWRTKEE